MDYKKIEELFVDFILKILGPNDERENERNNNLKIIEGIISNILTKILPDYIIHILPYGSFPVKTYLKDADVDITIFFESKSEKKILIDIPIQIIDKAILLIKKELENQRTDSPFELISDIKVILAGIRLLKCKIGTISFDISINNFSGLFKLLFIDYIENQLKLQFNKRNLFNDSSYKENKINIFRRTFLLIKGWCFYEGNLMGSNNSLMASYTLEILVIFLFNLHYNEIQNEFDGFEKFFELMQKIDWEKNIISLYGIISNFNFYKKLQDFNNIIMKEKEKNNENTNFLKTLNTPFWFIDKANNNLTKNEIWKDKEDKILCDENVEPLLNINEIKTFINYLNNGMGNIHLLKEGFAINGANFDRFLNVLDPINNHNNLGKSINYHNNSKMKGVINNLNKNLKKIQEIRKKGNPYLYINSLLNLFKLTLTKTYVEIFNDSLNSPQLISNSKIYKKFCKSDNNIKINIDKNEIKKFNKLFSDNAINDENTNLEEEDYDEYVEENEDIEEHDSENSEKEEEEEEEEEKRKEEDKIEENEIKNLFSFETNKKIHFEKIINDIIIKDLFEVEESKQKSVNYNNKLIKQSKDYSINIEKLLKNYKLI